jgi:heme exporter protein C
MGVVGATRPEARGGAPPAEPSAGADYPEAGGGWLGPLTAGALLVALGGALLYAPTERVQGDAQRIFYLHVPLAWVAYLAFFVVFAASVAYLRTRRERWDVLALASAEVGLLFTTLVLVTGSLWARPIWGTWWSWDARLTTTLVLWLLYAGYRMVRAYAGDAARGARYAAVLGIVGFLDVPLVHQSVVWWRTLHPGPTVVQAGGRIGMPAPMFQVLLLSLLAFTLLYLYLLRERVGLEGARRRLLRLRAEQVHLEGERGD